jgi:hypothetical protein
MNRIIGFLALAMLVAPAGAYAQGNLTAKTAAVNCPTMGQMAVMQKDMAGLRGDMDTMMKSMSDPAAHARMQPMRDHMTAMMANMQLMGGGMMGGATTTQSGKDATPAPSAAPPAGAAEHDAHHPDK